MKRILYADGLNNYIFIYHEINVFFKINPPCKDCLVQPICLEDMGDLLENFVCIQINSCSLLKEFIRKEQKKFNHI
jgi:hypothetical protein